MTDSDTSFWRKPMRVMDLALEDSHGSWLHRWSAEQMVEQALRLNANVLNVMAVNEWGQAYWPSPHLPMHYHVRVVQIQEIVKHAVGLPQVINPPGQITFAFLRDPVQATGRPAAAGIPARGDISSLLQATQKAVDGARIDRVLLKAKLLQTLLELVAMGFPVA